MNKVDKYYPKVLVCCPTSDKKSYCDDRYFSQLHLLSYPNYSVFICDNSSGVGYVNKIKGLGFDAVHINKYGMSSAEMLAVSHERLRMYAIKHNFDYMFHLESDVFVPSVDIIERLLMHRKPIVSAMYASRHGAKRWFLLQQLQETGLEKYGHLNVVNLDNGADINFIDGSVKEIFACGLGCSLIHKSVFSKIKFSFQPGSDLHPDTLFYCELYKLGIKNFVDTSLVCEHDNVAWHVLGGLS